MAREPVPAKPPAKPGAKTLGKAPGPSRRTAAGSAVRSATLHQWMQRTPLLLSLQQQALDSRRMGEELACALGADMAGAVQPGRFADGCWTLGASSSAVAAKLKLYVPLLLRRLRQAGWAVDRIQVRVAAPQPRGGGLPAEAPAQASAAPAAVRERLRALRERM